MSELREICTQVNEYIQINSNTTGLPSEQPNFPMSVLTKIVSSGLYNEKYSENISEKSFEDVVRANLSSVLKEKETINIDDLNKIRSEIKNKMTDYLVYRTIKGGYFEKNEPIGIDEITFYPPNYPMEKIDTLSNKDIPSTFLDILYEDGFPFLSVKVFAGDHETAIKKANTLMEKIERILNLRIISEDTDYLGIINVKDHSSKSCVSIFDKGVSRNLVFNSNYDPVEEILTTPTVNRLLHLLCTDKKTEMQSRLLRSAEWIGIGTYSGINAIGYVSLMTALESLSKKDEKVFLSESISAQLKDSVAIVLGTDKESRLKLKNLMGNLYAIRSGCTHGGKDTVEFNDYRALNQISLGMLSKLLLEEPYNNFDTISHFIEYINELKYSF